MEKAKNKNVNAIKKIWNNPNFKSYSGIILVIIVVSLFMNFRSPNFMTYNNIMNILRQIAVYGILACGMAFTMMTGGIDLTVGSIAGVSGAVVARLMVESSVPLLLAMLAGILIGAALGLICGTTIAYTGIPPFIMTLGYCWYSCSDFLPRRNICCGGNYTFKNIFWTIRICGWWQLSGCASFGN